MKKLVLAFLFLVIIISAMALPPPPPPPVPGVPGDNINDPAADPVVQPREPRTYRNAPQSPQSGSITHISVPPTTRSPAPQVIPAPLENQNRESGNNIIDDADESAESKINPVLIISIVSGCIVVTAIVLFILHKRKSSQVPDNLVRYVSSSLTTAGDLDSGVRNQLSKSGWSSDQIQKAVLASRRQI